MTVRLPCPAGHRWHDVDDVDAARIVAALTAQVGDHELEPPEKAAHMRDVDYCPVRDVLDWAGEVEMYYEYVEQALIAAQVWRLDDEEGRVVVPLGDRDSRPNGTPPDPDTLAPGDTMTVVVRDHGAEEAAWGHGPFRIATRTVTISTTCPKCGGRRGKPFGHNFVEDGDSAHVNRWTNPCGHLDMYAAVIREADAREEVTTP